MTTALDSPDVSVVLSTYNRAQVLPRALESLLDQDHDCARYEIVAVDNNSTDGTRHTIESFAAKAPNLRYVFEAKQGVPHARNTGILASRAPVIAFTDDDVRVSRDWVSTIARLFVDHPEAACVGGKVLPNWSGPWPGWLTPEHWSPLALLDYGDAPFHVTAIRRVCLIGANVAYRREVLDRIGMFAPHMSSLQDHEILLRLWRAGGQGLYWPRLTVVSDIAPERMQRRYHRRWHRRHGRFSAMMHDEDLEQTRAGRLFGVPAHLYWRTAVDLAAYGSRLLRGDPAEAFMHEVGLWFCLGFFEARWQESFSRGRPPGTTTAA